MTKIERLQRRIEDREKVMAAIMGAVKTNEENAGKECYTQDYDKALHIKCAIESAGFRIVRKIPLTS